MLVCYKVHLVILSHNKESQNTPSARLQSDIELWRTDLSNADNKLKVAQLTTVSHIAKHLQHQEAFLLPNVSAYLLDSYCGTGCWRVASNEVPHYCHFAVTWMSSTIVTRVKRMMERKKMTLKIQKMENGMIIHRTVSKVTLSAKL